MPKFVEFHLIDKRILGTPKTRLYHDFENKAGKPDFITSWSLEIWLSPKKKNSNPQCFETCIILRLDTYENFQIGM